MKNTVHYATSIILISFISSLTAQAQIKVWSDGAVKIGDLSKTDRLSGSSVEVAVNKLFIYPTNNLNDAFTIYNNTQTPIPGGGGIIVTPSSLNEPSNNRSTYVEPYAAGKLVLGTSSKPLGWVFTQDMTVKDRFIEASNTTIKKGAKLTLDHSVATTLEAGFSMEPGSELEIK